MKACKGCGADKGLAEFYRCHGMADGHLNYCKSCIKARTREYRRTHQEQYAEYERSRANLPHRVEARKKYQEEHREQITEYKKAWTEANAARTAASKREYYERNREEVIARSEEWANNNAEKVRRFKANNGRRRRAAKHASPGNFTAQEFEDLCELYGNRCLGCGAEGVPLEADHVVPLTRGGSDGIENIQPLCGTCNRSKFVKIVDFRADGPELPDRLGEARGVYHLGLDELPVEWVGPERSSWQPLAATLPPSGCKIPPAPATVD